MIRFSWPSLLVWSTVVFLAPVLCLGQPTPDSIKTAVFQKDLHQLADDIQGCQARLAELARLLELTEKFPHRYRQAEVEAFQNNLTEEVSCLDEARQHATTVAESLPKPPPTSRPPSPEATALKALHDQLAGLRRQLDNLDRQRQAVKAQLDKLAKKVAPPDSTGTPFDRQGLEERRRSLPGRIDVVFYPFQHPS